MAFMSSLGNSLGSSLGITILGASLGPLVNYLVKCYPLGPMSKLMSHMNLPPLDQQMGETFWASKGNTTRAPRSQLFQGAPWNYVCSTSLLLHNSYVRTLHQSHHPTLDTPQN